jgi:trimethylamine--corrinoid protein Co-methyltransferase
MRRSRANRSKSTRSSGGTNQTSSQQMRNPYAPMQLISEDQLEDIHQASLKLLCETGIDFQSPKAVDILRRAGAMVDDNGLRVMFDPDWIMQTIATTPSEFILHGRRPDRHIAMGGNSIAFAMVASTPNVSDLDRGRITGNYDDFCNLLRLGESLNSVQLQAGFPVEPCDINVNTRHLVAGAAMARLTTKPVGGYALGRQRMQDTMDIVRISRGIDHATLLKEPSIHTVVNSNSPLIYDGALLEGAIVMAENNQPVIYTPFTLAGAMAPITMAGALVQQNAECLAGLAFHQCVNPGAPAMYGSFTSNVDMKSGSPAFGTPEYSQATIVSGQLARKYGIPLRASNANASNAPDAQATYESQMSLWACMLGQVNYVLHGLGWIEGGLCTSYEKVILDAEMIQMQKAFLKPMDTSVDSLAVDAIAAVGPGSHFFASPHTMSRYEDAFYSPLLSNWSNFENWRDAGAMDATQRANKIWKQMLEDYEEPKLDAAIDDELTDFVERRTREGGAVPGT